MTFKSSRGTLVFGGLLSAAVACADVHPAVSSSGPSADRQILCEGEYYGHLQGVARGDTRLYWSFSTVLVKTDLAGRVLKTVPVPLHHGDLCLAGDMLYVAVNFGEFDTEDRADSWVYCYRADDLTFVRKWKVPELRHGAGGMTFAAGDFYVVGGLPPDHVANYVYRYDKDFRFVERYVLKTGYTGLGIQTANFLDGRFFFGCYGGKDVQGRGVAPCTLVCPLALDSFRRLDDWCDLGLVKIDGRFMRGESWVERPGTLWFKGRLEPFKAPLDMPARTVAWYRFEETEPGTRTSLSSVIRNTANPGVLDGVCRAVDTSGALVETASALPVSERVASTNRCLRFATDTAARGGKCSVDAGVGSVVAIPNTDGRLHLSSFTVEFFVKSDIRADWSAGYQTPLALPNFGGYYYSWGIVFQGTKMLFLAHNAADKAIGEIYAENVNVHDGRWHHVAVTCDGDTRVVRIYFDYAYRGNGKISAPIVYNNDYPLLIGASMGTKYRKWVGLIDEVRLSDEVRPVDEFLRDDRLSQTDNRSGFPTSMITDKKKGGSR